MTDSLDRLRRQAKDLQKTYSAGDAIATQRVAAINPRPKGEVLRHADFLHVVAREQGFASWPDLKAAVEIDGLDRAQRRQRLKIALAHGQTRIVAMLLAADPALPDGHFGLQVALFQAAPVLEALASDPGLATRVAGPRRPIHHLCFSRALQIWPEREAAMFQIAEALIAHGADVNDPLESGDGNLSPLYGALGHAGNMPLAEWLLAHGADPNDGESLYHATELGHSDGIRLLLRHGAEPNGTNALQRAIDFDDVEMVRLLLDAGADPNGFNAQPVGGEPPWTVPTLHQAARRGVSGALCRVLLEGGADPVQSWQGISPYVYARVYGHDVLAQLLADRGAEETLGADEALLAAAAQGRVPDGQYIDPARLAPVFRDMIRELAHLPRKIAHIEALAAIGLEYDRPDGTGVTPVQAAGWSGQPEIMKTLLRLRPDLGHVNGYGGTLLSTIIHGSENAPRDKSTDHIACARLALEVGVALPRRAIELAGDPDMADFLREWGKDHPGQVVSQGVG